MTDHIHDEAYNILKVSKDFIDGKIPEESASKLLAQYTQELMKDNDGQKVLAEMGQHSKFPYDFPDVDTNPRNPDGTVTSISSNTHDWHSDRETAGTLDGGRRIVKLELVNDTVNMHTGLNDIGAVE